MNSDIIHVSRIIFFAVKPSMNSSRSELMTAVIQLFLIDCKLCFSILKLWYQDINVSNPLIT